MKYLDITTCSVTDGNGFRLILWCSGCEHHCDGCHNSQSWDIDAGNEFTEQTIEHILDELKHPYIYGLTISGGDPLHPDNIQDVLQLCKKVKRTYPEKNIWVYTGYTLDSFWAKEEQVVTDDFDIWKVCANTLLKYIDVLVDGKYVQELRDITLPFRGSSNQRLIDVQKTLKEQKVVLYENN